MCSNFHHRVESTSHTCARTGAAILRESQLSHRVAFSFLLVLLIVVASPKENFAQRPCEDLARLSLTNVTITSATSLAAGTFKPPSDPHEPLPAPAYPPSAAYRASSDRRALRRSGLKCGCQSQAGTASSNRSATGTIPLPDMAEPLLRGFATAGTDDGHAGNFLDGAGQSATPKKLSTSDI